MDRDDPEPDGNRVEPLLQTLAGLDVWVLYALLGLLVLGESSAVLALLVPGEVALLVGGTLAARDIVDLPLVVVVAVVAAISGQAVGYEVGRRYGLRLLGPGLLGSTRRRGRYAKGVRDAAAQVVRHGGAAVFLGRWVNVSRVVVPLLAGAQRMPYRTFALFNVLGALAWVGTFVALGAAAGASLEAVHRATGQAAWSLVAVLAIGLAARAAWRRRQSGDRPAGVGPAACTVTLANSSRQEQDA